MSSPQFCSRLLESCVHLAALGESYILSSKLCSSSQLIKLGMYVSFGGNLSTTLLSILLTYNLKTNNS